MDLLRPRLHRFEVLALAISLSLHAAGATAFAVLSPFPGPIDEIHHLAYINVMIIAPNLFPDYGELFLNHPPLYYILLSLLENFGASTIIALRISNVIISTAGLFIATIASRSIIQNAWCRVFFYFSVFAYPKAAVVGGMINNDNLALLAAGCVFYGLAKGEKLSQLAIAFGLILAGWTKLTALIMLGSAWAAFRIIGLVRERARFGWMDIVVSIAICFAVAPYIVNVIKLGKLLNLSETYNFVLPDERPELGHIGFVIHFGKSLLIKWAAAEGNIYASGGIIYVVSLGLYALVDNKKAALTGAYLTALCIGLFAHLTFGWLEFQRIGDLSIAQTRYYNVLWPGLAACAAIGLESILARRGSLTACLVGALVLVSLWLECSQIYLLLNKLNL